MKTEWTELIDGEEKRYVDYEWFSLELEKARRELLEYCGGWKEARVEIYDESRLTAEPEPVRLQVNWCACGTVPIEEAERFMTQLQKAIELARGFKYNGYIVAYQKLDKDEQVKADMEIKAAYQAAGLAD